MAQASLPVTSAPWIEPDFPFFSSIVDARKAGPQFPTDNLTPRGLVLRVGPETWAAFDVDLLRVSAIWHGNGVTPVALAPGSYHKPDRKTPGGQSDPAGTRRSGVAGKRELSGMANRSAGVAQRSARGGAELRKKWAVARLRRTSDDLPQFVKRLMGWCSRYQAGGAMVREHMQEVTTPETAGYSRVNSRSNLQLVHCGWCSA